MKLFILVFIYFFQFSAKATHRIGNGGDMVVCPNSLEVLDFYEARTQRGVNLDIANHGTTIDEKVNFILARLGRVSPHRAQIYSQQYAQFFSEANFLEGVGLVDIPDSDHIAFPVGCKVEQTVVQVQNPLPGQKRYTINGDLWKKMDETSKAGMILHEIVYREAIGYGQDNSIAARYLNGLLASTEMDTITQEQFNQLLQQLDYKKADMDGQWVLLQYRDKPAPMKFYPNGHLQMAYLDPDTVLQVNGASISIAESGQTGVGVEAIQGPIAFFYQDGSLSSFACATTCGPFKVGIQKITSSGQTELFPDGSLKFASILRQALKVKQYGNEIQLPKYKNLDISFYSDGTIQNLLLTDLEAGLPWSFANGHKILCRFPGSSEQARFFLNGSLQGCWASEGSLEIDEVNTPELSGPVSFDQDGRVLRARFQKAFLLPSAGFKVLDFLRTSNGNLRYVQLAESARLHTTATQTTLFNAKDFLLFDSNGLVIRQCQYLFQCDPQNPELMNSGLL